MFWDVCRLQPRLLHRSARSIASGERPINLVTKVRRIKYGHLLCHRGLRPSRLRDFGSGGEYFLKHATHNTPSPRHFLITRSNLGQTIHAASHTRYRSCNRVHLRPTTNLCSTSRNHEPYNRVNSTTSEHRGALLDRSGPTRRPDE